MVDVDLHEARTAFGRGDWVVAHDIWAATELSTLTSEDLDDLATVDELLGRHDENIAVLHHLFRRHEDAGQPGAAIRCAFRLAMTSRVHGERALSAGWRARAEGLLDEAGDDCAERGWVALLRMFSALGTGAVDQAAAHAAVVTDMGRRHHDPDLTATGLVAQGRVALYSGRVSEGLALLDQAMVRVVSGELQPITAGHVFCTAIEGCQEISDLGRVGEWTAALDRWCSGQPGLMAFTGQRSVHRGQVLRVHGDWAAALAEFALAAQRYEEVNAPGAIGLAAVEAGDVHRLQGEFDAADAQYQRAAEVGYDPQPGLALLWLARGQEAAAQAAVARLLAQPGGPVQRCRVLPAAIEVLLPTQGADAARPLVDEFASLTAVFGCLMLQARAAQLSGALEVAAGDAAGAMPYLRKATQLWSRVGDPHHRALTGVLMGRALAALGDTASALREFEAALTTLRELGARPAAAEVEALLEPTALPAGLTEREAEVLRLVASGRSNAQIASDLVLSEKTVARHLSNIFVKLNVGSRTAATAFAFEHHLV